MAELGGIGGLAFERLHVPGGLLVGAMVFNSLLFAFSLAAILRFAQACAGAAHKRRFALREQYQPIGLSQLRLVLFAFAPGAIEVMVILGFALGFDPIFVAVHQVSRLLMISFALPFAAAWIAKKSDQG